MTDRSIDCAGILREISAYLDGELAVTECAAIDAHCVQCAQCRRLIEGLRRTVGLCRDAGAASLPDAVRARARDSVQRLLDGRAKDGD